MGDASSPNPGRRVDELCGKMLDLGLSDAEHAELVTLLEQDSESRARYREAVCLHAMLREESQAGQCNPLSSQLFGVRPDELADLTTKLTSAGWEEGRQIIPGVAAESRHSAGRKWAGRPVLAAAVGVLLVALSYETWLRPQAMRMMGEARQSLATVSPAVGPSIAQLTMANGCSWGGGSPQFTKLDSQVRSGEEITLHEGIAEFRLASDVSLSIEGPAALVLTSPTSLVLQHGRVTVYVPSTVEDFRLVTPLCRLAGREAEFGVQVASGHVDVHAFVGHVSASPVLGNGSLDDQDALSPRDEDERSGEVFSPTTIDTGRRLSLSGESDDTVYFRWHDADESQFATKLTMAGALPITKTYVDSVLKAKPLGYWRFEKAGGRSIANEASSLAELRITGDVSFVGDQHNHALELGRPGSTGFLTCKNELNLPRGSDYSVEIWMKPSHNHCGGLVAMNIWKESEEADPGAFCLLTWSRGRQYLRYLHRDPPGRDPKVGTDCRSDVPYRLRRWQHVVAVKRGPDMEIYLDGKLVGTNRDETSLAQHLCIIVGVAGIPRGGVPLVGHYKFIGQLDELAIYGRALGHDEIKQHIDAVKWDAGRRGEMQVNGI
jgi:hypothetical protein